MSFNLKKSIILLKQEIDLEEKKKILCDILSSQPVQGQFNLRQCSLNEAKQKNKPNIKIGKWSTKKFFFYIKIHWKILKNRFDFTILYEYGFFSKDHEEFPNTYLDYIQRNKEAFRNLKAVSSLQRDCVGNHHPLNVTQETCRTTQKLFDTLPVIYLKFYWFFN